MYNAPPPIPCTPLSRRSDITSTQLSIPISNFLPEPHSALLRSLTWRNSECRSHESIEHAKYQPLLFHAFIFSSRRVPTPPPPPPPPPPINQPQISIPLQEPMRRRHTYPSYTDSSGSPTTPSPSPDPHNASSPNHGLLPPSGEE